MGTYKAQDRPYIEIRNRNCKSRTPSLPLTNAYSMRSLTRTPCGGGGGGGALHLGVSHAIACITATDHGGKSILGTPTGSTTQVIVTLDFY